MPNSSFRFQHLGSLPRAHISHRGTADGKLPRVPAEAEKVLEEPAPRFSPRMLQAMSRGAFEYMGHRFFSRSEAACAEMMRRYLGFEIREKETVNVPIGVSEAGMVQSADMVHGSVVIEYHPPVMRPSNWRNADKSTRKTLNSLKAKIRHRRTRPREREELREEAHDILDTLYTRDRREILNRNPDFKDAELIVVRDKADFYEKVIKRFGDPENIPDLDEFEAAFESIQSNVIDHSARGKKKRKAGNARRKDRSERRERRNVERASRYAYAS